MFSALLVALFCGIAAAQQLDSSCSLGTSNAGILITPSSLDYQNDKRVFNLKVSTAPKAIAYCYTEAEVVNALLCAKLSGLEAVPRGGGHGYEGYAVPTGSVVIDVTNITNFSVDKAANTATFGPGLRLGQLYLKMYLEANSLFPAGTCPWVGTPGHLLGGGTGLSVRKYGMACDNIVSLTMVDYQGNVLTASNTSNPDLLWASCGGGGGNLGIVTSFTVKLNSLDAVSSVTVARLSWGYENAVAVFDKVQRWAPTADRRLGVQILIGFGSASVNIQYEGVQTDAQAAIQASGLLDISGIQTNEVTQESWINATLLWASESMGISDNDVFALNMTGGLPPGQEKSFQAASSYNQQLMSMEGIQTMVNAVTSLGPSGTGYVEHKMLGGAVGDPAPDATAFYWRQALYETQWFYYWTSGDSGPANAWLSSTINAMKPYVGQGSYINYPDPLLAATSAWPTAYYGGNLQAYTAVKTKYDPTNYFSNPLTVTPITNSSTLTPASSKVVAQAPSKTAAAVTHAPASAPTTHNPALPSTSTRFTPALPTPTSAPTSSQTLPQQVASAG